MAWSRPAPHCAVPHARSDGALPTSATLRQSFRRRTPTHGVSVKQFHFIPSGQPQSRSPTLNVPLSWSIRSRFSPSSSEVVLGGETCDKRPSTDVPHSAAESGSPPLVGLAKLGSARAGFTAHSLAGNPCRFANLSARSGAAEISDLSGRSHSIEVVLGIG